MNPPGAPELSFATLPMAEDRSVGWNAVRDAGRVVFEIAKKSECEVVADVAIPYPSQVFLTLFGLPLEERDRLIPWQDSVIALADAPSLEAAIR